METYRIHFKDGTSTLIVILQDDSLQDAMVSQCEMEGWSVEDVTKVEKVD